MKSEKYDNVYLDEKTNKWMFRIWIDGKQLKKRGFDSDSKANKAKMEFIRNYDLSKKITKQKVLFSLVAEDYREKKEQENAESSLVELDNMLDKHILPFFSAKDIFKITIKDIEDWKKIKLKETYYNKVLKQDVTFSIKHLQSMFNVLNNVFKRAIVLYGLKDNPCVRAENFKRNKNVARRTALTRNDFWTLEELIHFLSFASDNDFFYALFLTLGSTGVRIGEILALTVEKLDTLTRTLTIDDNLTRGRNGKYIGTTKEGREKAFKLPEITYNAILKIIDGKMPDDRIFNKSYSTIHRKYKEMLKLSGNKHIKPHGFRHTFITAQLEMGTKDMTVAKMVGHSTTEQLKRTYGHLYEQNIIDASDLMNDTLLNKISPKQAQNDLDNKKSPILKDF